MKVVSILLLAIVPFVAAAGHLSGNVGVGKGLVRNQFGSHEQFERYGSLAYGINLTQSFYLKAELGGWLAFGEGRRHNVYGAALLGFRVRSQAGLYAMAEIGPAVISSPDSSLGSHFQFDIGLGGGLMVGKVGLGAKLKHFSNAGIWQPNRGIDAVCFDLTLRL